MANSRLLSIIRKEFIQITRDVRTLVIILIIPIIQLFLLGYSATSDIRNIPLAVYDQSRSPESRALLDAYRAADYFRIAYTVGSEDEIRMLIETGDARAAIIIPPDYSQRLVEGDAQVAFILDGSDPTSASTALSAAVLVGQAFSTQILSEKIARSGMAIELRPPVEVRATVWSNSREDGIAVPESSSRPAWLLAPFMPSDARDFSSHDRADLDVVDCI